MTLDMVEAHARTMPLPDGCLDGCETGLLLFAAGFLGVNDGWWVKQAGLTATCVDNDPVKLGRMRPLYPDDWEFVCADAYQYAADADRQWDFVSVDPFTNDHQHAFRELPLWLKLARRSLILGIRDEWIKPVDVEGWRVANILERTSLGVCWLHLEHEC